MENPAARELVLASCGGRSASRSGGNMIILLPGGTSTNFEHLRETKDLAAFLLLV